MRYIKTFEIEQQYKGLYWKIIVDEYFFVKLNKIDKSNHIPDNILQDIKDLYHVVLKNPYRERRIELNDVKFFVAYIYNIDDWIYEFDGVDYYYSTIRKLKKENVELTPKDIKKYNFEKNLKKYNL